LLHLIKGLNRCLFPVLEDKLFEKITLKNPPLTPLASGAGHTMVDHNHQSGIVLLAV